MLKDARVVHLARQIVRHSLRVKPGDSVLIDSLEECDELIVAVLGEVDKVGGHSHVLHQSLPVRRAWLMGATEAHFKTWFDQTVRARKEADCILSLRGQDNACELIDVPEQTMRRFGALTMRAALEGKKDGARITVVRFPSRSLAQQSGMSTEAFTDHFFRVCCLNFPLLRREMEPLKTALDRAATVRIVAPGTELSFSIMGVECGISAGTWNLPDGEAHMNIVRESVEGTIAYNVPSSHLGFVFRDIVLEFHKGRVTRVQASDRKRVEAILDTDEGARYVGEFAIGVNPYLQHHIIDTLFDEKMAGSLHFTPSGTDSKGVQSQVHWDIVQSHLPHYGGGEIHLDGKLWRKDGLFVDAALKRLNPEELAATLDAAATWIPGEA
jgi:aminopeptidase